mmetsp:Transcript_47839/g.55924  ORF Transcript_47839/g.55924 Transcript_47839/m.55924 type:complete len:103 (-) Transcript_47839:184-492(-)
MRNRWGKLQQSQSRSMVLTVDEWAGVKGASRGCGCWARDLENDGKLEKVALHHRFECIAVFLFSNVKHVWYSSGSIANHISLPKKKTDLVKPISSKAVYSIH